jgi:hypothetical protein
MKANLLPEPERWSERAGGTAAEDAIGASFKRIKTATEPSAIASMRWARHAMAPVPRRAAAGLLWTGIVGTLLVGSGAAAGVAWHARVTNARARAVQGEPLPGAHGQQVVAAPATRTALPPPETPPEAPPTDEPAPGTRVPHTTPPALPAVRKDVRVAPTAPVPDGLPATEPPPAIAAEGEDEAQLVARAFRRLRNEGDARGALAALDQRERRFGAGTLATEAALARVEALLLLGRTDDALPLLLRIRDTRAGLTPEVRATRAELLARSNRCDEAAADLDQLLAPGAPAATRERALYARASCRLQSARPISAIPDLESYLAEFPDGRSAEIVRAALERLRRP